MGFSVSLLLSVVTLMLSLPAAAQSDGGSRHFLRAQAAHQNDQPDSAAHYARRALAELEQQQRWNQYANVQAWLGDLYRREGRSDSAFFYLSRALVTVTSSPVHDTTRAATYHNLGRYYYGERRPEQALQTHRRALTIREARGDSLSLVDSYTAIANVYRYIYFDFITAEQYYQKALSQLNPATHPDKKLFDVLYSLATTNRLKEDYDQALAYGYQAATLAKGLSRESSEVCYTMLGNILDDQGEVTAAIANYESALALGIERLGNQHPDLIVRLNNLAAAYLIVDKLPQAKRLLRHALRVYQASPNSSAEARLASTHEYLGDAYAQQNHLDSATTAYQQSWAVNLRVYGPHHPNTVDILSAIGQFYVQQSAYDSALRYFQRSLMASAPGFNGADVRQNPTVAMMMHNPLNFQLFYQKALALLQKHQQSADASWLEPALDCFARADSLMDSCRVLYDREAAKLRFLANYREVYEQAVGCAYRLHQSSPEDRYLAWAFHFMEKSKAVVLWEALVDSQSKTSAGVPDSLLTHERSLKVELAYLNNELLAAEQAGQPDSIVTALRTRQFSLSRQQEALTQQLRKNHPTYFRIKYGQDQHTLAQAQQYTQRVSTLLVEYLWGEDHLYAIGISPRQVVFDAFPLTDTLRQSLTTVLAALRHPPRITQSSADFQTYTTAAHTVYRQWLFPLLAVAQPDRRPLAPSLFRSFQEAQQWVHPPTLAIIPDGPLAYLPFEALLTQRPTAPTPNYRQLAYVLDTFSVSYAPSSQVLAQGANNVRNAMRFLAFGYSGSDASAEPSLSPAWRSLPGTTQEIKSLDQMAEGTFYTGVAATESQFKAEAERYDVIHLAVHGLADTLQPNNSHLVFRTEHDSIDDGYLYSYELYDLQLQADLAVLSACESGTGKMQQGEGVYSLARGFTYAGCPTVVMSLWRVDDQQTASLMPAFYRALFAGQPVDQALRAAKLKYREQCTAFHAHPAFWSAFVVGGAPTPIISYQSTRHAAVLILLLSGIYASLALYGRLRNHRAKRTGSVAGQ